MLLVAVTAMTPCFESHALYSKPQNNLPPFSALSKRKAPPEQFRPCITVNRNLPVHAIVAENTLKDRLPPSKGLRPTHSISTTTIHIPKRAHHHRCQSPRPQPRTSRQHYPKLSPLSALPTSTRNVTGLPGDSNGRNFRPRHQHQITHCFYVRHPPHTAQPILPWRWLSDWQLHLPSTVHPLRQGPLLPAANRTSSRWRPDIRATRA